MMEHTREAQAPANWSPQQRGGGYAGLPYVADWKDRAWSDIPVSTLESLVGRRDENVVVSRWLRRYGTGSGSLWPRSAEDVQEAASGWNEGFRRLGVSGERALIYHRDRDWAQEIAAGAAAANNTVLVTDPEERGAAGIVAAFRPTILVISAYDILEDFMGTDAPSLEQLRGVVLTGGMSPGRALRERIQARWSEATLREVYAIPQVPGPLAIECAQGRWHWPRVGGDQPLWAEWLSMPYSGSGDLRQVVLTHLEGQHAVPLLRVATGDIVHMGPEGACACGQSGMATGVGAWALAASPVLRGRLVPAAGFLDLLNEEPAVGAGWRVDVRYDRGLGRDMVVITIPLPADHPAVDPLRERATHWLWGDTATAPRMDCDPFMAEVGPPDFHIRDWRPVSR